MFLGGDFSLISPASLLQTLGQERRSVQIRAWRGHSIAQIQLLEGMVVAASCDELHSDEALYRFAAWDSGRFFVTPLDEVDTADMAAGWEELLLEAARRRDELEMALPALPPYPSREQLLAVHADCPALSGLALLSRDGRLLGALGIDEQLVELLPALLGLLEPTAELLQSQGICYISAGRRRLLLVERGDHRLIGEPAPDSDLRAAAAQMAAQVGLPVV